MGESTNTIGAGVLFGYGDGGNPEVFTNFAELADCDLGEITGDEEEVSHHTSPSFYKEYVPGFVEPGEGTIVLNYKKTDAAIILALFRVRLNFQMVYPDGSTYVQKGFLKGFGRKVPLKTKILHECKFKWSGPPVWDPA